MTAVLDRVTDVQDQVIDVITKVKAPATDAVTTVVEFVLDRVPEIPVLPYAEVFPTPKEIIDNQAKFASKLVTTNKDVALSVARAAAPVTDKLLDRKTVAAKKAAAKKAA
jgi:hypothetical protein